MIDQCVYADILFKCTISQKLSIAIEYIQETIIIDVGLPFAVIPSEAWIFTLYISLAVIYKLQTRRYLSMVDFF